MLIVEDGSGVTGANTYAALQQVDAYHTAMRNTAWTDSGMDDDEKSAYILRGMSYLETRPWRGQRKSVTQSLSFPRVQLITRDGLQFPDDMVPQAVVIACCQLALAAKQLPEGSGFFAEWDIENRLRRRKVDIIEREFFKADPVEIAVPVPGIDMLLMDYIDSALDGAKGMWRVQARGN